MQADVFRVVTRISCSVLAEGAIEEACTVGGTPAATRN
jgi:hypothetical protein